MRILQPGIILIFLLSSIYTYCQENNTAVVKGLYLGEESPGTEARVFAKGIISTEQYEHSAPAFSPDGRTVLWTIVEMNKPARLMEMTMTGNAWSAPHSPSFADTLHDDFYPFFSADGKYLLFSSRRVLPTAATPKDMSLWIVERKGNNWGAAIPFDTTVSKGVEYAHSLSKNGDLFFSVREVENGKSSWKIFFSKFIDKKYTTAQPLDTSINNGSYVDGPFVAADESFLVFESDRAGGMGSIDLYICFKDVNGKWSFPKNMGAKINSPAAERFAGVSPDGKYLFFGSNRSSALPDIYWISSKVIDELK